MDLVEPAPKKVALVTPAVPPIIKEGNGDVAKDGSAIYA